jgi:hypothetical protein
METELVRRPPTKTDKLKQRRDEAQAELDQQEAAVAEDAQRRASLLSEREGLQAQLRECESRASRFEEAADPQHIVSMALAGTPGSDDPSVGLAFAGLAARKSAAEAFRLGAATRRERLEVIQRELTELEQKYRQ